jgi:hypothetical protein
LNDALGAAPERAEELSERMVVHYYLRDEKHSMDAFVRNKAEAEMLALVRHVLLQLNLDVKVETAVQEEGGLVETWLLIVNNPAFLVTAAIGASGFLIGVVNIIIQLMYARDRGIDKLNRELTQLGIDEKRLSIEERKLNLEKLRAELLKASPSQDVIERTVPALEHDSKTITLRSNFFKLLLSYQQVTAVGFGQKPKRGTAAERIVKRGEFSTYVVRSDKLPTVVHHDAVIEIVAPVIGKGSFHWRGVWQGEPITFQMRDIAYRSMVERGQEVFRRGDAIKCELNVERKVDALGDEVVTGHAVTAVTAKIEGAKEIETSRGKQIRYKKTHGPQNQSDLFKELDEGG